MRKYNVYNLKVVKVETSTNIKYLICRYNNLTQEYIEVLTGEKIEVKNSENVEPLSNYYSVLGLHCYGMPGSELELTKKDILSKYLEINSEEIEEQKNDNENTSNERLNPFLLRKQELLEIALLGDPGDDEFKVNYFPTNVITKSLILDSCKKDDDNSHINNKELTELAEGLKRTREELITLCETNPKQAKKLAIEALIRTGVIESSDEIEKSKPYIKERKEK